MNTEETTHEQTDNQEPQMRGDGMESGPAGVLPSEPAQDVDASEGQPQEARGNIQDASTANTETTPPADIQPIDNTPVAPAEQAPDSQNTDNPHESIEQDSHEAKPMGEAIDVPQEAADMRQEAPQPLEAQSASQSTDTDPSSHPVETATSAAIDQSLSPHEARTDEPLLAAHPHQQVDHLAASSLLTTATTPAVEHPDAQQTDPPNASQSQDPPKTERAESSPEIPKPEARTQEPKQQPPAEDEGAQAEGEDPEGAKDKKKPKQGSKDKLLKALEEKYKLIFKENSQRKEDNLELFDLLKRAFVAASLPAADSLQCQLGNSPELRTMAGSLVDAVQSLHFSLERKDATIKKLTEDLTSVSGEYSSLSAKLSETSKELARKQKDLSDLLVVLKAKEEEVEELKKINKELKTQIDNEADLVSKFKDFSGHGSGKHNVLLTDEYINLKNELDNAYTKIDSLEDQMLANKKQFALKLSEKDALAKRPQVSVQTETAAEPEPPKKTETLEDAMLRANQQRKSQLKEEDEATRVYFKNLIIRYMVYEAKQNESECDIIRRAILDYLKIEPEERNTIDDAIKNRGGLKDALSFFKMFGSQN